jgi:hypothetical protein
MDSRRFNASLNMILFLLTALTRPLLDAMGSLASNPQITIISQQITL